MTTIGRNTPCPCGSGKKFKQCCINNSITPPPSTSLPTDQLMQRGYAALDVDDNERASDSWLMVWEIVKTRLTPDIRSIEDAESLFPNGEQCLFNWCQDMEEALANAGLSTPSYNQTCLSYCREFCALLPDTAAVIIHNMKRAAIESLFRMGQLQEGEQATEELIATFPDEAFSYICAGDHYYWPFREGWPADYDRAEEYYRMALDANIEADGRSIILERLQSLTETRRQKGLSRQ